MILFYLINLIVFTDTIEKANRYCEAAKTSYDIPSSEVDIGLPKAKSRKNSKRTNAKAKGSSDESEDKSSSSIAISSDDERANFLNRAGKF